MADPREENKKKKELHHIVFVREALIILLRSNNDGGNWRISRKVCSCVLSLLPHVRSMQPCSSLCSRMCLLLLLQHVSYLLLFFLCLGYMCPFFFFLFLFFAPICGTVKHLFSCFFFCFLLGLYYARILGSTFECPKLCALVGYSSTPLFLAVHFLYCALLLSLRCSCFSRNH